mgnify:FL=1
MTQNFEHYRTFHFAHVITALLSFYEGKPITPSTSLIQGIQSSDSELDSYLDLMDPIVLQAVVVFLVRLDRILSEQYDDKGCMWMGREVSLAGLFGALGAVANETNKERIDVMNSFYEICQQNPKVLNLRQFEEVRNSLDLSKVNIGNVNRQAVFSATKEILMKTPPSTSEWKRHFGMER